MPLSLHRCCWALIYARDATVRDGTAKRNWALRRELPRLSLFRDDIACKRTTEVCLETDWQRIVFAWFSGERYSWEYLRQALDLMISLATDSKRMC